MRDWTVESDRLRYGWGCADSAAVDTRLLRRLRDLAGSWTLEHVMRVARVDAVDFLNA